MPAAGARFSLGPLSLPWGRAGLGPSAVLTLERRVEAEWFDYPPDEEKFVRDGSSTRGSFCSLEQDAACKVYGDWIACVKGVIPKSLASSLLMLLLMVGLGLGG